MCLPTSVSADLSTPLALREDLLDRERRRQQVEGVEVLAGPADLARVLVAVPQLLGEVGAELVGDDEP
jgi:hypothetical protein